MRARAAHTLTRSVSEGSSRLRFGLVSANQAPSFRPASHKKGSPPMRISRFAGWCLVCLLLAGCRGKTGQEATLELIHKLGGSYKTDDRLDDNPVVTVDLRDTAVADNQLAALKELPQSENTGARRHQDKRRGDRSAERLQRPGARVSAHDAGDARGDRAAEEGVSERGYIELMVQQDATPRIGSHAVPPWTIVKPKHLDFTMLLRHNPLPFGGFATHRGTIVRRNRVPRPRVLT